MIVKSYRFCYSLVPMVLFCVLCNFAHAQLDQKHQWDIPQQPLGQTLIAIGMQSGISIVFPSYLTKDLSAVALDSTLTARQALDTILAQQPLTWQALNNNVVSISKKAVDASPISISLTPTVIEEMLVVGRQITGSRLKRLDYEGSSPVDIITSPELDASGVQSVSEYLKFIPAVSGNSTSTSVSNGGDGTATITLRGLPASNTLVLINGIRTANSGMAGDSVDLNSIPLAAVERIEVLKDGASAIYGSDAIAGVVNIILKESVDGISFEQYYGQTSRHDLTTSNTGLMLGNAVGNTEMMLIASHYDQEGIFSRDRDLSEDADGRSHGGADLRSSATPFTRIGIPNGDVLILSDAQQDPNDPTSYRVATDEDLYNYRDTTSSVSPSKRSSVYVSGIQALSPAHTLSLGGGFTNSEATVTHASYPLYTAFESVPLHVGANNPYNPFGVELYDLRRRLVELGPRFQNTEEKSTRINATIAYQQEHFHWDVGINWNKTKADWQMRGLVDLEKVSNALSDACVTMFDCIPLDLFGPPGAVTSEQLDYIGANVSSHGVSKLREITSNFSTTIASVFNAPIGLAFGAGMREENIDLSRKEEAHAGISESVSGGRNVWDAYAETTLPLIQYKPAIYQLELEAATRYSHYDDFGSTNNPKFGLRYRPIKNLLLRSTRSKGFRAPGLYQMFKERKVSYDVLLDPCTMAANVGVLPGCTLLADPTRRQIATYTGGNLDLEPEQATSKTLGLVWTPEKWQNFYLSIDWFQIEQEDIIDARAQYIIDQNAQFGTLSNLIDRDANGNLVAVRATNLNVGNLLVEGVDATIRYRLATESSGNFVISINGSHLRHYQQQLDAASAKRELAGNFVDQASEGAGALPDWKFNAGFSWLYKHWEFNYNVFYVSPLTETVPYFENRRHIGSWTNQNAQLNYSLTRSRNIRISLGIDNIFDKMPPFAASAFNDNFDQRTYELKGRNYYAQLKYHF